MREKQVLAQKAANIAKATPVNWRDFCDALAGYIAVHQENLLKSPLPELPVNQGRAQALATLFALLQDCIAEAAKTKG